MNKLDVKKWMLCSALAVTLFQTLNARADIPTVKLLTAPLVTPTNAFTFYAAAPNATTHTNGVSAWTTRPVEIVELARALGGEELTGGQITVDQYASRVFEYVRNNIDVEFRFGLGKGARGAIIDQSGTSFDQAQLMVELLREPKNGSGASIVTASYRVGTITLNAQQFGQWSGLVTGLTQQAPPTLPTFTVNAQAACQFLADGGIPATVNSATSCTSLTGNLTTVTLGHIWVAIGSNLYDPSFKRYNLRQGVDLGQKLGCGSDASPTCGNSATTAALTGSTSGTIGSAATLTNINETQLATQLNTFATNLQTYVEANIPDAPIEEVIGGRLIDDTYVPTIGTALPYTSAQQLNWTGDIPDPFRTRFHVVLFGTTDPVMFADELAGQRMEFAWSGEFPDARTHMFVVDDVVINSSDSAPTQYQTSIDHPYAASNGAYGDDVQIWYLGLLFGGGTISYAQSIVLSLGNTGEGLPRHFADREHAAQQNHYFESQGANNIVGFIGTSAQSRISSAQLLYQESLAVKAVEGVSRTRVSPHHAMGIAGDNYFTVVSQFSIASKSNDSTARAAAFENLAVTGAMIEGSLLQQQQDVWSPGSAVAYFSIDNARHIAFMDVNASNLDSVYPPPPPPYDPASLQALAASGYSFILPNTNCIDNTGFPLIGGNYYTAGCGQLMYRGDSVSYLLNGILKGGSIAPGADDPLKTALDSAKPPKQGLRNRDALSVSVANGDLSITAAPDLVTGVGSFPYALPFQRTYRSSNTYNERETAPWISGYAPPDGYFSYQRGYYGSDSHSFSRLGGGWTHNYEVTASLSNDGSTGLGAERGVDALATIAALYTITDLARSTNFSRRLTSVFAAHWLSQQFMTNVAVVERLPNSSKFVRLPSGTFRAPPASAERLVQTGNRSGALCLECSTALGITREPRTAFDYSAITLQFTDAGGSTINFSPSQQLLVILGQNNSTIYRPTFAADSWTFPTGVVVNFQYQYPQVQNTGSPAKNLVSVSNNLGRSLTFANTTTATDGGDLAFPVTRLTGVSDENGRSVSFEGNCTPSTPNLYGQWGQGPFGCRTFEVVTPDGTRTVYGYESTAASPQMSTASRSNYRLRSWFTPDDLSTAFLTVDYNSMYQVRGVIDKSGFTTKYFSTGLYGRENKKRGELMDALGAVTTQYFDRYSKQTSSIDPLGRTTWSTYDDRQRLLKTILPEGNFTQYSYDVRSNVLTEIRNPKSGSAWGLQTITNAYKEGVAVTACANPATCNKLTSTTDYLGHASTFSYNPQGQLTQIVGPTVNSTHAESDFCYAAQGAISMLTGKVDLVGNSKPNRVTKFAYNSANKFVLSSMRVDPPDSLTAACAVASKSPAQNLTTSLTFDAIGNVQSVDGPRTDVSDSTTYTFDLMRRIKEVDKQLASDPQYSVTKYEYYDDGALKSTSRNETVAGNTTWRTEILAYKPTGELLTKTDPEGNVTTFDYDAVGRQNVITDPDNRKTATIYDAAGQTRCIWKGWNGSPSLAVWSNTSTLPCDWNPANYAAAGSNGPYRHVSYDIYSDNGKVLRLEDADNNITESVYDKFDRLRFTLFPSPSQGNRCTIPNPLSESVVTLSCPNTATYEELRYTGNGNPTGTICNGNDQVCVKRTRNNQTITYAYDTMNRVASRTPTGLPVVNFSYNLLSEPLSLASASQSSPSIPAHNVTYDYNDVGRKLFEKNTLNGTVRQISYGYDASGNRTSTIWPDSYVVSYEYDDLNRMSKVWEGAPNTGGKLADYAYDTLSRRQGLQYAGQATNKIGYTYEPDSNLDVLTNILSSTTVTLDYSHNKSGQITTIDASDTFYLASPATAITTPYVPNKLNQYNTIAGQALTYDNSGNLLTWFAAGGNQTYTYDSENRLRTAAVNGSTSATITYDYDALGRRLSKVVSGTSTFYLLDGDEEIAEYNSGGTVLRRYITGAAIDDRIAHVEISGSTSTKTYYHVNHQGSVIAMTDGAGTIQQQLSYDEYGNLTSQQPPASTTGEQFRFTGRRFDIETGLYYYRARYYSPPLGRFLQTDPIGYKDDFDLYSYVGNDPLDKTDPTGQVFLVDDAAEAVIVGGAVLVAATCYFLCPKVTESIVNIGKSIVDKFKDDSPVVEAPQPALPTTTTLPTTDPLPTVVQSKESDSTRVEEQRERRRERRERESRAGADGARDQSGSNQKPSGEGHRDHESANKGKKGERPKGPDRKNNRERNQGIDEEHSIKPKGGLRDRG